jgi:hypothetical protein
MLDVGQEHRRAHKWLLHMAWVLTTGKLNSEWKQPRSKNRRTGFLAQVVECLPSKLEGLSSNPNSTKRKRKFKRQKLKFQAHKGLHLELPWCYFCHPIGQSCHRAFSDPRRWTNGLHVLRKE